MPTALVACALCVVLVEFAAHHAAEALWRPLYDVTESGEDDVFRFRAKLESLSPDRPAVLVMGSSQVREGTDTDAIERHLHEAGLESSQVINLGVAGGAFLELNQQLDPALQVEPALILASPGPHGLYWPPVKLRRLPDYNYALPSAAALAWHLRSSVEGSLIEEYLGLSALYRTLPSSRLIRSYRLPALVLRRLEKQTPDHPVYSYARDLSLEEIAGAGHAFPKPVFTAMSAAQTGVADRLTRKVQRSGTPIVFVDYPVNPGARFLGRDWEPSLSKTRDILLGLSDRYGVRYIEREALPPFVAGDFRDLSHLNESGREKMARFLAEVVMHELAVEK